MAAGDKQITDFVDMTSPAMSAAITTLANYATTDIIVPVYQGNTVAFIKIKTA